MTKAEETRERVFDVAVAKIAEAEERARGRELAGTPAIHAWYVSSEVGLTDTTTKRHLDRLVEDGRLASWKDGGLRRYTTPDLMRQKIEAEERTRRQIEDHFRRWQVVAERLEEAGLEVTTRLDWRTGEQRVIGVPLETVEALLDRLQELADGVDVSFGQSVG